MERKARGIPPLDDLRAYRFCYTLTGTIIGAATPLLVGAISVPLSSNIALDPCSIPGRKTHHSSGTALPGLEWLSLGVLTLSVIQFYAAARDCFDGVALMSHP